MKIAYQTAIWGPQIDDLGRALDTIASTGFKGVDFAQPPETLPSFEDLNRLLGERDLALVGLSGGTLEERWRYCADSVPCFVSVDEWDPIAAPRAIERGLTLALRPHAFKKIRRLADAHAVLNEHRELKWAPDTAFLTVVGDDLLAALRLTTDRLIAVYLRDWTSVYGRSTHRYSRGFTELGRGEVALDAVLSDLTNVRYDGWVIVGQDSTRTDPEASLVQSADWLARRGNLPPARTFVPGRPTHHGRTPASIPAGSHLRFLQSMMRVSTEHVTDCYNAVAEAFAELLPCRLATVWAWTPLSETLSLLAASPMSDVLTGLPQRVVDSRNDLTNIAIQRLRVTTFDLAVTHPGTLFGAPKSRFQLPELLAGIPVTKMVVLPLLSPFSPTHVTSVACLFPTEAALPIEDEDLLSLGTEAAKTIEWALDELCAYAAGRANMLAGRAKAVNTFAEGIVALVRELIGCEGCSVFLVNQTDDRLDLAASTGVEWSVDRDRCYRRGEGLTGRVWSRNEPVLTSHALKENGWIGKSSELVPTEDGHACLLTPLIDSAGRVIGVVRCRNKVVAGRTRNNSFSDDDVSIVDAIGQVCVPHLQLLLSEERRAKAVTRLVHELRSPLVAIRGAAQSMDTEIKSRGGAVEQVFRYPYLQDVWSWTELMLGLLQNARFFGLRSEPVRLAPVRTFLMADVVAPAVRQVEILLRDRRFAERNIRYGRFEQVPPLWIDRSQFHQVVFNLLSNAIKYAYADPSAFQIEIDGGRDRDGFLVSFRDWGIGIEAELEEAIFEEGVRGPKASLQNVAGQGLGLWVVRQIVEAHGGSVSVTHLQLPTEFTVRLPVSLAHPFEMEWRDKKGRS